MKRLFKVEKGLKKCPGIYIIKCTKTEKVYIGETVNLSQRLGKHFSLLRANKHSNPILQNIFNKYGEECFIVDVLEYLNTYAETELKILERQWQQKYSTCISLDSNEIYHIERTEDWKKQQREYLDIARDKAIAVCKIPCIVYDIINNSLLEFNSLEEATSVIERKHIDKNLKGVLTPYKNQYVAFKKDTFS